MPTDLHPDSAEYQARFRERAEEQLRRHQADPLHEPEFLGCDDEEFPSEYTFGMPEES